MQYGTFNVFSPEAHGTEVFHLIWELIFMYAPYLISFSYNRVPRSPTTIMFSAKRTYSFFQHLVLSVNSDHLSEGLDADDTTPRHTTHYATPHHTMPRLQRRRRLWLDKDSHPLPLHPQLQPLNHLVHTTTAMKTRTSTWQVLCCRFSPLTLSPTSNKSADQPAAE